LALVIFAGSGALQEVWGFNRIQTRTPGEGVGQAMGAGLWCMYLGRVVGAAAATWGATHLSRPEIHDESDGRSGGNLPHGQPRGTVPLASEL